MGIFSRLDAASLRENGVRYLALLVAYVAGCVLIVEMSPQGHYLPTALFGGLGGAVGPAAVALGRWSLIRARSKKGRFRKHWLPITGIWCVVMALGMTALVMTDGFGLEHRLAGPIMNGWVLATCFFVVQCIPSDEELPSAQAGAQPTHSPGG